MPVVQLAAHAKSSTLYVRSYGRTVVHPNFFRLDELLLFCIIIGLHSASSTMNFAHLACLQAREFVGLPISKTLDII